MSVKRSRKSSGAPGSVHDPYQQQHSYESPVIPDYDSYSYGADNGAGQSYRSSGSQKRNSQSNYPPPTFAQPSSSPYTSSNPTRAPSSSKRPQDTRSIARDSSYNDRLVASDPMAVRDRSGAMRPSVDTSGDGVARRSSISHKSPLQKLEGALDGVSKEEKRARVAEAESLAQEKATRSASSGHSRSAAAFENGRRDSVERRHGRSSSGTGIPPLPMDNRSRGPEYHTGGGSVDKPYQANKSYNPRGLDPQSHDVEHYRSVNSGHKVATAGALMTGAGLVASQPRGSQDYAPPVPPKEPIGRGDSKRLQKQPPKDRRASGSERSPAAAVSHAPVRSDRDREYMNGSSPAANSVYHTPPQEAVDRQRNSDLQHVQTDRGQQATLNEAQHGFRLPHIFHRHRDGRRYQQGAVVSDWRNVPTVTLSAEDLDLTPPPQTRPTGPDERPWWEKSSTERRTSATYSQPPGTSNTTSYGPNVDSRSGQTYFRPPIYLKSGPFLRFRGIYIENSRSGRSTTARARQCWRGSIMIVTIDSKSRYETAPTLRLFKQPLELLPPPPQEVRGQKLAPEYVDPIAGQVKMSRVGKTLYVRPVEHLEEGVDLSRKEDDSGLFEEKKSAAPSIDKRTGKVVNNVDGEKIGKVKEVQGVRLFAERGCTFWKFNVEIELGSEQQRIAYRINRGPAVGFWVPARDENMNIMFHSCNGFSLACDPAPFSGPDPLWRDVLNSHQTRPFHVMLGGGDQIYMDAATKQTKLFKEWTETKNPHSKHNAPFTAEMQDELEKFYLDRYAMWFSQGFFGMANSQIPMVNMWDDHDIMDGFGSYPDSTMSSPVFQGVGAVAFKYYMLFQHQTVPEETETEEPSWILGFQRGPFIQQRSRSVFMSLGPGIDFLGLDCRTERARDEVLSEQTWEHVFQRLETDIVKGQTKHLLVLLGVPIAYPRLNFLENVLTSRVMDPVKAIGRTGALGGFVNKFDGGVEILDDLDDHWTAKHHKDERNWFIQELQHVAASKSVRVTILGGDVHLAAIGSFFSNAKLGIPKDRDHRYMPNVISSAIVNTPPADMVADVLNKRNKIHHLDDFTDENMIPIFTVDVDGKPRNNKCLLPRRNWCAIRDYVPSDTPVHSPGPEEHPDDVSYSDRRSIHSSDTRRSKSSIAGSIRSTLSKTRGRITSRFSKKSSAPPMAFYNKTGGRMPHQRTSSADAAVRRPNQGSDNYFPDDQPNSASAGRRSFSINDKDSLNSSAQRPNKFVRVPTGLSEKQMKKDQARGGGIDLTNGLDIHINVENVRGEPAGTTTDYHMMVPALDFRGEIPDLPEPIRKAKGLKGLFGSTRRVPLHGGSVGGSSASIAGTEVGAHDRRGPLTSHGDSLGGWTDGSNGHQQPSAGIQRTEAVQSRQPADDRLHVSRARDSGPKQSGPGAERDLDATTNHSRKSSRAATQQSIPVYNEPDTSRLADGRQIHHPHHRGPSNVSNLDLDSPHDDLTPSEAAADQHQRLQEHRKKRGSFAAKAAEAVRGSFAKARGPRRRYPEDFEDDDRSRNGEYSDYEDDVPARRGAGGGGARNRYDVSDDRHYDDGYDSPSQVDYGKRKGSWMFWKGKGVV